MQQRKIHSGNLERPEEEVDQEVELEAVQGAEQEVDPEVEQVILKVCGRVVDPLEDLMGNHKLRLLKLW